MCRVKLGTTRKSWWPIQPKDSTDLTMFWCRGMEWSDKLQEHRLCWVYDSISKVSYRWQGVPAWLWQTAHWVSTWGWLYAHDPGWWSVDRGNWASYMHQDAKQCAQMSCHLLLILWNFTQECHVSFWVVALIEEEKVCCEREWVCFLSYHASFAWILRPYAELNSSRDNAGPWSLFRVKKINY